MISGAVLSKDKKYRYSLFRIWDKTKPIYVWIMLNPSTAGVKENDPTIKKCIGFVKRWKGGGLIVVNLFSFRATDPKDLWDEINPIGKDTDKFIEMVKGRGKVVLAWGSSLNTSNWRIEECFKRRPKEVLWNLAQFNESNESPYCLGLNKNGSPKHPVRLAYSTPLIPYNPPPEKCPSCKKKNSFRYDPSCGFKFCSNCDFGEDNLPDF